MDALLYYFLCDRGGGCHRVPGLQHFHQGPFFEQLASLNAGLNFSSLRSEACLVASGRALSGLVTAAVIPLVIFDLLLLMCCCCSGGCVWGDGCWVWREFGFGSEQ